MKSSVILLAWVRRISNARELFTADSAYWMRQPFQARRTGPVEVCPKRRQNEVVGTPIPIQLLEFEYCLVFYGQDYLYNFMRLMGFLISAPNA